MAVESLADITLTRFCFKNNNDFVKAISKFNKKFGYNFKETEIEENPALYFLDKDNNIYISYLKGKIKFRKPYEHIEEIEILKEISTNFIKDNSTDFMALAFDFLKTFTDSPSINLRFNQVAFKDDEIKYKKTAKLVNDEDDNIIGATMNFHFYNFDTVTKTKIDAINLILNSIITNIDTYINEFEESVKVG